MSAELFEEQAEALKTAHDQGAEAFGLAADGVLRLVADYPNQIFGETAQHDDGQRGEAYQTALAGLSGRLTNVRLRHDFAVTFDERLREAAGAREEESEPSLDRVTLQQIGRAFLNSFPDEVGTFSSDLAAVAEIASATSSDEAASDIKEPAESGAKMALETADPEHFGYIVDQVLRRAGSMMVIIGNTDTPTKRLEIGTTSAGPRLTFSHGRGLRDVTTIGTDKHRHLGYYFARKQTVTGRDKGRERTTLEVKQADFMHGQPHELEGDLSVVQGFDPADEGTPLKDEQTVEVANRIIGEIQAELDRRQKLYDKQTADAQKRIEGMFK
ncbi:MAG TPA: hypothetical protein VIJ68_00175 [Candidatus Saccharimonadales bacterium]